MTSSSPNRVGAFFSEFFSLTPKALEGFVLMWRHPLSVLTWTFAYLGSMILLGVLITYSIGKDGVVGLGLRFNMAAAHPERIPELIWYFGWIPALLIALSALLLAVIAAAIYRAVLAPGEFRFGYVRLGMDEVRLLFVTLLTPIGIPGIPLAIGMPMAATALFEHRGVQLIGVFALAGATFWILARLSLAGPMTMDHRKHSIGDSWAMTRGKAWPLIWLILLLLALSFCFVIFGYKVNAALDVALDALIRFERANHHHGSSPGRALIIILQLISPAFFFIVGGVLVATPFAAVYRDWRAAPVNLGVKAAEAAT